MRIGRDRTTIAHSFILAGACVLVAASQIAFAAPPLGGVRDIGGGVSTDPVVIAGQVRSAVRLGKFAVGQLAGPDALESFNQTHGVMSEMYAQVRLAVTGMYWAKQYARFPDPLLDYESKRTHEAWVQIRGVVDRHIRGDSPVISPGQIPAAIHDLNSAIAILEQVLELMP
ncbi:MAG: hypothetical protein HYS14_06955 [Candidatus Rokubacteria bacterium]|nr:hypothetical protein [Candidatus Rokubacteria bacterium]